MEMTIKQIVITPNKEICHVLYVGLSMNNIPFMYQKVHRQRNVKYVILHNGLIYVWGQLTENYEEVVIKLQ